jgi:hypothetical protein
MVRCDGLFPPIYGIPAMTEVESLVEPDGVADNIWRESVALVCIHRMILAVYLPVPFVSIQGPILAIRAR